jgi:hypothetical protein
MRQLEVAPRLPMTVEERRLVHALAKCQFHADSADKRFCRDVSGDSKLVGLTNGQSAYLWRLCHRYRHQLPTEITDMLKTQSPLATLARAGRIRKDISARITPARMFLKA